MKDSKMIMLVIVTSAIAGLIQWGLIEAAQKKG